MSFKIKATPNLNFLHKAQPIMDGSKEYFEGIKENIKSFKNKTKNKNSKNPITADSNDVLSSKATVAVIADILKKIFGEEDKNKYTELMNSIKSAVSENERHSKSLNKIESRIDSKKIEGNIQRQKMQKRNQKLGSK